MTGAAIYARVSTARQAERDLSLPDQIAQCRAYCERQGWDVVEVFCEPGASALDDDRAVFQEMIYKATRPDRPFTFIVVHSLSRFSRDSLHSELYVRKLRKAGVELVSITQTVSSDPSGEMFRKLLNVFDEHQSRENAKHVHRAMCENARQGFWNGSHPPFGYETQIAERRGAKDKKVLVIDDEEACIVREIFALAAGREGRPFGVKAIACRLTERGISRRGVRFSTGSVYEILTSSTYFGQHHFNRRDSRTGAPRPPSQWVGSTGSCDHRRIDVQRGPGAHAEPQPETDAAARRERPDLPRRNRPVWLLRRRDDPEHRQGRALPLLLLFEQAEEGTIGLPRFARADGEAGRDRGRRGCASRPRSRPSDRDASTPTSSQRRPRQSALRRRSRSCAMTTRRRWPGSPGSSNWSRRA